MTSLIYSPLILYKLLGITETRVYRTSLNYKNIQKILRKYLEHLIKRPSKSPSIFPKKTANDISSENIFLYYEIFEIRDTCNLQEKITNYTLYISRNQIYFVWNLMTLLKDAINNERENKAIGKKKEFLFISFV